MQKVQGLGQMKHCILGYKTGIQKLTFCILEYWCVDDTIFVGYFTIFDFLKIALRFVQSSCLWSPLCSRFNLF